jgi:hypothetical protein
MINFLSIARQIYNLTQQQVCDKLAKKLGKMSIVTIRKMEDSEKIKKVAYSSVIAYCQLLEITEIKVPETIKSE